MRLHGKTNSAHMFRRRRFGLCVLLALGSLSLFGQPIRQASYETMLKVAHEQLAEYDYVHALEWFEKAYEEADKPDSLLPYLADLEYKLRDYGKAERTYRRILRKDPTGGAGDLNYYYGQLLKINEKYKEAEDAFIGFIAGTDNDSLKTLARAELEGARMAPNMEEASRGVKLNHAGKTINSKQSEYSPVLGPDGNSVYFAGFDTEEVILSTDDGVMEYPAKIFMANKGEKGWEEPKPLPDKVNRPDQSNFNVAFSPDGSRMYFARGTIQGNELVSGDMYYSAGDGRNWGAAQEVEGINGDYIVKNPAVGDLYGREVLFFASDMPGGYGGFDLYYATKESDGKYGAPANLGPVINTLGDDESPFFIDGTLYFSSTGHPGIGGFDIFYTVWDGTKWSEPQNMGKGFNTSVNDTYFSMDQSGRKGFLVSNRPGEGNRSLQNRTCCYDIYDFEIPEVYVNLVAGIFSDEKKPLAGGTVTLFTMERDMPGAPNRKTNQDGNRFEFGLDFDKPYMAVAERDGYFPDTVSFNTVGIKESKTIEHRFFLKPKPVEPEFDTIYLEEPIVLENILYDFDSDRIQPEAESDLQVVYDLMIEHPEMRVELSSHTDNRGDDQYNKDLSQRRAESARRWLVRKEISRERIEAVGHGESQPFKVKDVTAAKYPFLKVGDVLTPDYIAKLSTEEQQEIAHSLNRRTEFRILEGPTSITIKRTSLRKKETGEPPRRNTQYSQPQPGSGTVVIHPLSSLYGRTNLKGVPIMDFKVREVDFGAVRRGEKREYTYAFVNKGDVPLKIDLVSACECTTAEFTRETVKPGGRGQIHIVFDSTEKEESEEIVIDVFLENEDPERGGPIFEQLKYKYKLLR